MRAFHVVAHVRPHQARPGPPIMVEGRSVATLQIACEHQAPLTYPLEFEVVYQAFERLPRLYIEPDGSFIWVSSEASSPWQLDGNLVDRNGQLQHVELKGRCDANALDQLLERTGQPAAGQVFQLLAQGVFVDYDEFMRLVYGDMPRR